MASNLFLSEKVESVKGKDGLTVPVKDLDGPGKVLGLYFSAHWCPPCRGFTPKLADWYKKLTGGALKDKLEIVFVSSDRDEASFDLYYKDMPWLSLPFDERDAKAALSKKYKIQGIPTLVLVNAETGELITKGGRGIVQEDQNGDKFPWTPKPFGEVIQGKFVNKSNEEITWNDCKNKIVGLYFSAHWCPPCQKFTPELAKFYNQAKANGKNFEVIFVSSDNSEEEFKEYLDTMPWYAIPYQDNRKEELDKMFEISGIPTLIILEKDTGKVITSSGRGMVSIDPNAEDFPWHPKPVEMLHSGKVDDVNERPCMIWFTDGSDEQVKEAKSGLEPVAAPYFESNRDDSDSVCFLYTKNDSLAERLQSYVKIGPPFPALALINMGEQCKYVCEEKTLNSDAVKKFFEEYKNGTATKKNISE